MLTNVIKLVNEDGEKQDFATKYMSDEDLLTLHNGGVYEDGDYVWFTTLNGFDVAEELVSRGLISQYWEDDPTEEDWAL